MTLSELEKANELKKQMEELQDNIYLLNEALKDRPRYGKLMKFFFRNFEENKIRISSQGISFGGILNVDRGSMELLKSHFDTKFKEVQEEFQGIGKEGAK